MSNALVRKKKRMQPLGYSKSELIGIQKYAKAQNNADYLITESYYNVRMMAYQALHDMFGFGQKRCQKFMAGMDKASDYIDQGLAEWIDYVQAIKEELGIELSFSGEIKSHGE